MEKRKNTASNNNQLLIIGAIVFVVLASGAIGTLLEVVFGIVFGVIGLVIGLIGGIIGLVVGLIGAGIGLVGAAIGVVFGTAIIWVPLLAIVLLTKSTSSSKDKPKREISISN